MKPELINSLKGYKKSNIVNDLLAGLMVAIIALPLSIALGIQSVPESVSTNGIQFGIITAIVAGFFISALGGSRFQIGGPTAAFVVILYSYLANPDIGILGLALAGIMAGVILILMGVLRAGSVMKFFPYPIVIGFTTGIGVTLLVGQIKDLCGFTSQGTEAIEKVISYIENIKTFHLPTFIVGLVGLAIVIIIPKINKKIPSAFIALIACTLLSLLLNGVADAQIQTIGSKYGDIKAGFYPIDFSSISSVKFSALIVPSIVIAFLCAIESLLSATVAAGMTNTSFNSNQELVGQGVANIFSSLLGGLPATGAIARTAAGIENGAKSPLTGVFHSIFVLIMYFALMGVMQYIPLCVFSAILISVAINMSRFKLFGRLTTFGVRDSIILIATCALTIIFDLTYGVIGGVVITLIANIMHIKKGLKMNTTEAEGERVVALCGSATFINASKMTDYIEKQFEDTSKIRLDLASLDAIDQTALEKLAGLFKKLRPQGKELVLEGANDKTKARIEKFLPIL